MPQKYTDDVLHAILTSVSYQGPAGTIYVWTGVQTAGVLNFQSTVRSLGVPNAPGGVVLTPNMDLAMSPIVQPSPGAVGSGILIFGINPDISQFQIGRFDYSGVYQFVGRNQTDLAAYDLVQNAYNFDNHPTGDFAWRRRAAGAEFLDISTVDGNFAEGDYVGLNTGSLQLDSDSQGRTRAARIPLAPNLNHWWRVTSLVDGVWYVSPTKTFLSTTGGGGGGSGGPQIVSGAEVTFA